MKRTRIRKVSAKTRARNAIWKERCIKRANELIKKYGHIICEYSGERIDTLASVNNDLNDGWGHHIDGNRNNTNLSNCYIVKYKYHTIITDRNIRVSSEDFKQRELFM